LHGKRVDFGPVGVRVLHRMAKREARANRLRFLPLHLAMEGFLALHFGGPDIAWTEYSRRALRDGLSPRCETSVAGRALPGFEDALRVFEMHENQVGVLVFVAEALASAFVTPTPEDYRALHKSLLEDFYSELIYQYGLLYPTTNLGEAPIDATTIHNLADLRTAVARRRADWGAFHGFQAGDLLAPRPLQNVQIVYTAGPFTLLRFLTDLDPARENHIGEAIVRTGTGQMEYLKTYRLSAAQTRRAYLLGQLAAHDWRLDDTARALRTTRDELVLRLEKAGFGYLLIPEVLQGAQARARTDPAARARWERVPARPFQPENNKK
jgi:hypothetical protein